MKLKVPLDLLLKVNLLRCPAGYPLAACTNPRGQIADFNLWDSALNSDEMVAWTTCRLDKCFVSNPGKLYLTSY